MIQHILLYISLLAVIWFSCRVLITQYLDGTFTDEDADEVFDGWRRPEGG